MKRQVNSFPFKRAQVFLRFATGGWQVHYLVQDLAVGGKPSRMRFWAGLGWPHLEGSEAVGSRCHLKWHAVNPWHAVVKQGLAALPVVTWSEVPREGEAVDD